MNDEMHSKGSVDRASTGRWSNELYCSAFPEVAHLFSSGLLKSLEPIAAANGRKAHGLIDSQTFVDRIAASLNIAPLVAQAMSEALAAGCLTGASHNTFPSIRWLDFSISDLASSQSDMSRLPSVEHAIVLPSLGAGGAEKVAFHHYNALSKYLQRSVAIIAADGPTNLRNGYLPEQAHVVDLPDMIGPSNYERMSVDGKVRLLQRVLSSMNAKYVHIVNSYVGFEAVRGGALDKHKKLVSLFCYHHEPNGRMTGYARYIKHLNDCVLITDSDWFREYLIDRFGGNSEQVIAFAYPVREVPRFVELKPIEDGQKPLVLWASRLDYQKNPATAFEVARKLPGFQFHVYGSSIMDDLELGIPPANVELKGSFTKFSDIPTIPYLCMLYTSRFDGKPNIVLEAMGGGLPIVGPDVGGVGEVIASGRGILVDDPLNVTAYVESIIRIAANIRDRNEMARAGVNFVTNEHSQSKFDNMVAEFYSRI